MYYGDKKESMVNICLNLKSKGWEIFGYKEDSSDSYQDIYNPASWGGIATKNGFVLCVSVSNSWDLEYSGKEIYTYSKNNYSAKDNDKIQKLQALANDSAASDEEKDTALQFIAKINNSQAEKVQSREDSKVLSFTYPVFQANPKGCNWHVEKDGKLFAKGKGAFQFSDLPYSYDVATGEKKESRADVKWDWNEESQKTINKFESFCAKINNIANGVTNMGDGTDETELEGLEAQAKEGYEKVMESIIKTVTRPVKVERDTIQEGDILSFPSGHGGLWRVTCIWENSKGVKCYDYKIMGSEKRGYQELKNAKGYYQVEPRLLKQVKEGYVIIHEMKTFEETTEVEKLVKISKPKAPKKTKKVTETPGEVETIIPETVITAEPEQNQEEGIETNVEGVETMTKNYLDTMQAKFKAGEGTAQELRTYYNYLLENVEAVKVVILDMLNNSEKHKRKRAKTKAGLTEECYDNMVESLVYHVQDFLSYSHDFSGTQNVRQNAIKKVIDSATDEMIQDQYNKTYAEKVARTEQRQEIIESIQNPQTLKDFENVKYYRKDKTLTIEEHERYDILYSLFQKEKRIKEQQERAGKALLNVMTSNDTYTITADVDTRDNSPLWVVKLINKVDRDQYKAIAEQMKLISGWYSRFKKGFIFKYDPTSKLLGEQSEENQVEQPETQSYSSNNSDKLRKVADNMQSTIDSKRADRKTNTAKRAREASNQEQQADSMEQIQGVLRNVADAIESNELTFINHIDSRAQIDTLETILFRANWKYKSVENIDYNVWHETPITADIIRYTEIPSSTIYLRQLQSIINDIKNTEGFKLIANRLQKLIDSAKLKQTSKDNDILIDITDYDQELDKIYKNTDALKGQYFETAIEERKRLARMGVESVEELRTYLREYFNYRSVTRSIDPVEKKIKDLERTYRLQQRGDINFTPSDIALQMIEYANIDSDSIVLEPNAGIGNIADQIKKFTNNIDVCEQMSSYSELLILKGFNVVGSDFLQYKNLNYYDCIIANPPFSQETIHIKHAYDLLKVGGKLIAITSPHWTFANDKSSKEFREWFNNTGGEIAEELESGTFEMTGVRSNIIVITKDTETLSKAV